MWQVVVWIKNGKDPIEGSTGAGFALSTDVCQLEQTARDIYESIPVNETIDEVSLHVKTDNGWRELETRENYNGTVVRKIH